MYKLVSLVAAITSFAWNSFGFSQECLDEDLDSFECSSRLSDKEIKNMYESPGNDKEPVAIEPFKISVGVSVDRLEPAATCKTLKYKRPAKSYMKCSKNLLGVIAKGQVGYILDNHVVLAQVKVKGRLKGKKGIFVVAIDGNTTPFTKLSYRGLKVAFYSEEKIIHKNYTKVSYGQNKTLTVAAGAATGQSFAQNLILGQDLNPSYIISGYDAQFFLPREHLGAIANYFGLRQKHYSGTMDAFSLGTNEETNLAFEGIYTFSSLELLAKIPVGPQKLFWLQLAHSIESDYKAEYKASTSENRVLDSSVQPFTGSKFEVSWKEQMTALGFYFEPNPLVSLKFGLGLSNGNAVTIADGFSSLAEGKMDVQQSLLAADVFLPPELIHRFFQLGMHFGYTRTDRSFLDNEKSKKNFSDDQFKVQILFQSDF